MALEVRRLNEQEFEAFAEAWQALVERSGVNSLFLGWAWQFSWWETWSQNLGLELVLIVVYEDGKLIGIAPLYLDRVPIRRRFKISRLQFIGNAWRRAETVRTEYLDFICDPSARSLALTALLAFLRKHISWDEFIIRDMDKNSPNLPVLRNIISGSGYFCFTREVDYGTKIDTTGIFNEYLLTLGSNTRLKLYNRRSYLAKLGTVSVDYATLAEAPVYFSELNRLHRTRWGKDCFCGPSLKFHNAFLNRLPNGSLHFSRIRLENDTLSLLYNVRINGNEFNIQAGYLEDFDKKVSLGTLHLGYAIENAFEAADIKRFDLLAGGGKNTYYKSKLAGERVDFMTLQITRNRLLKWLYKLYLISPVKIRSLLPKNLF